jgi:hypothetical protein
VLVEHREGNCPKSLGGILVNMVKERFGVGLERLMTPVRVLWLNPPTLERVPVHVGPPGLILTQGGNHEDDIVFSKAGALPL